ncbi:MAG TPA: hypothetical protein VMC07_02340 [Candidatus Omnitrophota bacterium]|nr:hypothetical protein [Candidatus Omnitrophota bacterium]
MDKLLFPDYINLEIPNDIIHEIIILHSLGVGIEDLKYLLVLRLNDLL